MIKKTFILRPFWFLGVYKDRSRQEVNQILAPKERRSKG